MKGRNQESLCEIRLNLSHNFFNLTGIFKFADKELSNEFILFYYFLVLPINFFLKAGYLPIHALFFLIPVEGHPFSLFFGIFCHRFLFLPAYLKFTFEFLVLKLKVFNLGFEFRFFGLLLMNSFTQILSPCFVGSNNVVDLSTIDDT